MFKLIQKIILGISLLVVLMASSYAYSGVSIIVSPGSSIQTLSSSKVVRFYTAKELTLDDGKSVVLVEQSPGQPTRDTFYQNILKKSESSVKRKWTKMLFTGKATPPIVLKNDADVKRYIASNPGSIGYISTSSVDDTVKVVYEQQ